MHTKRAWKIGDPEPYPWPDLRDSKGRRWVSCPAGWHLEESEISDDNCVGWATLVKHHGPLTEDWPALDR